MHRRSGHIGHWRLGTVESPLRTLREHSARPALMRKVWKRFMDTVEAGGLSVAKALYDFMNDEALPETGQHISLDNWSRWL